MITNFDLFRWKKAGMTNLGVNKLLKFFRKYDIKISLRQMGQVAQVKSIPNFIEQYKNQDVKKLRIDYKKFSSFSILDDLYPERLREIYNPPVLIFYQGNIDLLKNPKLAFVGSRLAGQSGIKAVQKIITELNQSFTIVSGLAKGIDTASHLSAIKTKTPTIAVIGTGLDIFYPLENRKIQEYLAKNQLVLSEYSLGEKPLKYHFPERNRIIAGLSRGVVVVEAKLRSGSLITCERALEEGRDIFAIPGNIADGTSDDCNHLIQQGAKLVYQAQDILEEYLYN
ncbi:DNA processing SMF protein [Lactococcus cremoris]|uniref:DNA processing SMF protein n=1 Tax=Lactococcus lactis subsp. cremoris TaxID=1359 RepID=Q25AX2_LACLC|nr:DNA-processing protein DprA [Lactococcus cremoris]ARE28673.1 DNA-processing protein DprA [Lactococcus cremoris]EUN35216.1 DNA protecting protein DprA [Lactococcus cremoris subsp. cremoris HP]KZK14237.1 Rossmann fold nucleotide-binding protein Smf involved in DNA uptake [Lactococcus cremoris]KZK41136.1 Rossmann fold nucleotide-binding protein Smf involved in DNA uptake [Lactococcus cremoris]KZK49218.1 Rossmann fold nucleotide-binding protein Smf involved in DNA uptake [Lactococcus cremoris]